MVEYTEWTRIVHQVYKANGGTYGSRGVTQAVTRAAARFWQENKMQIISLTVTAARTLAEELIEEYINRQGSFP